MFFIEFIFRRPHKYLTDPIEEESIIHKRIRELKNNLDKLKKRYALYEISKEIFIKVSSKHKNQLTEWEQKKYYCKNRSSNLSLAIKKGIAITETFISYRLLPILRK